VRSSYKTIALWVFLIVVFVCCYQFFSKGQEEPKELGWSELQDKVAKREVRELLVKPAGNMAVYSGALSESGKSAKFRVTGPLADSELTDKLHEQGVDVRFEKEEQNSFWLTVLGQWVPVVILFAFFIVVMRQLQGTGGKAMTFGKSKAKLLSESHNKVTFADVAGIDECKEELEEIIAFLKDPKKFTKLGGRIPKGVLMMGPPGTGKTLLAKAVAGEAGVPFFSISGSDFVEMFVGVGASRVRDLFEQGKKNAPCIIFIDEIDAVGRHRGAGLGGGHDEREQTLNQLLVEMDGFESNDGVILIAATNRPDVLDPALQRPGRFDRRIVVPRPDLKGRLGILAVHTKRVPLAPEVDLEVLSRGTPGMTGADLENLVNESALFAARQNKERVDMTDFEAAKDKVLMGPERKSMIMSEKEKRITAVHEAGHALVAKLSPNCDPIHKVTIIPRGQALGLTQSLPAEDKHNWYRKAVLEQIGMAMGGRIAEELVFDEMSSGAASDIEHATAVARAMVCRWGMSEKLGPLAFGNREGEVFLGRDLSTRPDYSEDTARQIDGEVRRIVTECYERSKKLLVDNVETLKRMADALMEYETLEADDVNTIVNGGTITRQRPPPRVSAPPKLEKKEKRKILDALEGLPKMEPNKA
jgi:cell division protease FtsH